MSRKSCTFADSFARETKSRPIHDVKPDCRLKSNNMKKLFSFLCAALLGTTALWADSNPQSTPSLINIDGSFADWDHVPADRLAQASTDENAAFKSLYDMKFCTP